MLVLMNIIAALSAIVGVLLLAHKVKWGFAVYFITELSMGYIGWKTQQYGICVMSLLYFCANIYAYAKWTIEEAKQNRRNTW